MSRGGPGISRRQTAQPSSPSKRATPILGAGRYNSAPPFPKYLPTGGWAGPNRRDVVSAARGLHPALPIVDICRSQER
ncbi:hypothetical protein VFPFJ_11362 [Purpureocillium lilacinum]|uniref:Uncharacterized protein n=1 Tax=Purpureocillium lilacinum TaxID=33203 RepID=A0A179FEB0_PURLI|nr:hypothetical protein VFPFJ_11362 [Purpureocillium lilacinum]OAQ63832.1 hypothetical protein VFPFJ_11362 [Purpureocillium lilacinum]OAQ65744.1 hypothetical protein VFPBJ_11137 [Purpureocillium lilacinum]